MRERILLVGEDRVLLETRAFLLFEWETCIADTHGAVAAIQAESFDLVIVGQLVKARDAHLIISSAQAREPAPAILAIRSSGDADALGVDTHQVDLTESPAWLSEWVRCALEKRSTCSCKRRMNHRTNNLH